MKNAVFWAVVRKDVYLMRGFSIAAVLVGLGAIALVTQGGAAFAVGGILFLTVGIASGIFISMFSVFTERKEHARLFALSLPISGRDYDLAKLVASCISYGVPWLILTLAALALFVLPPADHVGRVVYVLMLQGCVLALFCLISAAVFFIRSEGAVGIVILVTNILFSLFMVSINQPGVAGPLQGPELHWTPYALRMLGAELVIIVVSAVVALTAISRKRDHL